MKFAQLEGILNEYTRIVISIFSHINYVDTLVLWLTIAGICLKELAGVSKVDKMLSR